MFPFVKLYVNFISERMKVILLSRQRMVDYARRNSQSRTGINHWMKKTGKVDWNSPVDIVASFSGADLLGKGSSRIIFNIGGNKYRTICTYHFGKHEIILNVRWIGTHAEYTKLCISGQQYTI